MKSWFFGLKVGQGLLGMGKIQLGCRTVKRKDENFLFVFNEWAPMAIIWDVSGWVKLVSFRFGQI